MLSYIFGSSESQEKTDDVYDPYNLYKLNGPVTFDESDNDNDNDVDIECNNNVSESTLCTDNTNVYDDYNCEINTSNSNVNTKHVIIRPEVRNITASKHNVSTHNTTLTPEDYERKIHVERKNFYDKYDVHPESNDEEVEVSTPYHPKYVMVRTASHSEVRKVKSIDQSNDAKALIPNDSKKPVKYFTITNYDNHYEYWYQNYFLSLMVNKHDVAHSRHISSTSYKFIEDLEYDFNENCIELYANSTDVLHDATYVS